MANHSKTARILYPTAKYVQDFHDTLIKERGDRGWMSKGMVEGCIEWVKTDVYNFIPFPSLLAKAGALAYAYINFHPFTDGNKRTALMTTAFFFFINGYTLTITDDAPEVTKEIAKRTADTPNHSAAKEIIRISDWLRSKVNATRYQRLTYFIIKSTLPKMLPKMYYLRTQLGNLTFAYGKQIQLDNCIT
jgi:death-on-curing family protein